VIDRELLELGVEEAQASYEQQQKDLEFAKASQEADLSILEITTERHRQHLGRHDYDLQRYTVYAPMDGMVVRQSIIRNGEQYMPEVGDNLRRGQLFVRVMDIDNMQVEGSINQAESHLFKVGMEARIGVDAFPGVELPGRVLSIGAIAQSGTASEFVRTVPLNIKIEGSHEKLLPDLSAYADVILERREDVTQVPRGAVFAEDGQDYVYVRAAEGLDKRPVELGDRNHTHAEVVAGLSAGDVVALAPPAS
jgi:multidrug efflux pump subunit AcrA (membrane-fusion protein)